MAQVCTPLTADTTAYTADITLLTADMTEICVNVEVPGGARTRRGRRLSHDLEHDDEEIVAVLAAFLAQKRH